MRIEIRYIKDSGNLKKERVVLKILSSDNVGNYLLADTTQLDDGSVTNVLNHVFWIPDQEVNQGDTVVIYSKKGQESKKVNKSGKTSYFFYWGLERAIWNDVNDSAILIQINQWIAQSKKI